MRRVQCFFFMPSVPMALVMCPPDSIPCQSCGTSRYILDNAIELRYLFVAIAPLSTIGMCWNCSYCRRLLCPRGSASNAVYSILALLHNIRSRWDLLLCSCISAENLTVVHTGENWVDARPVVFSRHHLDHAIARNKAPVPAAGRLMRKYKVLTTWMLFFYTLKEDSIVWRD